jgi:hypothetical protein
VFKNAKDYQLQTLLAMVDSIPGGILDGILQWVDGGNVTFSDEIKGVDPRPLTIEDVFYILAVYDTREVTLTQRGILWNRRYACTQW